MYKFVVLLIFFLSCKTSIKDNLPKLKEMNQENCILLDKIKHSFYNDNSNYHLNVFIPIIEKKSGLESSATKGTIGYHYLKESDFIEDYKRWSNYFSCK